ncbi:MAG: hypothetical protein ACLQVY_20790 [Limisphaerales bacterium]
MKTMDGYSTPQSPQTHVTVACPNAQTAGNANILAIGWNDTVASISAVGDSAANAYQVAVPTFRANGLSQAIYYATSALGRCHQHSPCNWRRQPGCHFAIGDQSVFPPHGAQLSARPSA